MRKVLLCFVLICAMILLELFYINLQLEEKISRIENSQKQYHHAIESIHHISDQTLNGIMHSHSYKVKSLK